MSLSYSQLALEEYANLTPDQWANLPLYLAYIVPFDAVTVTIEHVRNTRSVEAMATTRFIERIELTTSISR